MRVVFCGSPAESAESLRALLGAKHEIAAVVTRPDRPRGRGRRSRPPPVRLEAEALGLPCLQPEDVNDLSFLPLLTAARPDLLVVVAYGAILKSHLLELAPRGAVNLHFSLLPALRGASPVEWALLRGHEETGVTTIFMAEKVDAGDIILSRSTPIGPDETAGELLRRLSHMGSRLLVETLSLLEGGAPPPRERQDPSRRSRAPRLSAETARIDWARGAREIHNQVRALNPRPGAVAGMRGKSLKVWRTRLLAEEDSPGTPGEIVGLTPQGPVVSCGRGTLVLLELQEAGKRTIPGDAFARGRHLSSGEVLSSGSPGAGSS